MKIIIKYILSFIAITQLFGCKKFIEIDPPKNLVVSETVFADNETATAALLNIYVAMVDNSPFMPFQIPFASGLQGDELKNFSTNVTMQQAYVNELRSLDGITNSIWSSSYSSIFKANAVIEGCNNSVGLSSAVKNQIMGEAYFVRAFWHTYLVNFYGDIPLATSTSYSANNTAERQPKTKIYEQVIADLKMAQSLLNENYVGINSIITTTERVRPNKVAATALLARVYLYTNNYADAIVQSSAVIDKKPMYDLTTLDNVFLKNSSEAIWQLMKPLPNSTNVNTYEGFNFILTGKPATTGNSISLSSALVNAFETADQRKVKWVGKVTDATVTPNVDYYFPSKYKVKSNAVITEYSMVLRLAEQYLIRAEAKAQSANLAGAIDDLDVIRARAGLTLIKNTNPSISKDNLLAAILKERQVELFTEWGNRWIDLKRVGKIDEVMSVYGPTKGATWSTYKQLWPIPQSDILNNPKLTQNPGYN